MKYEEYLTLGEELQQADILLKTMVKFNPNHDTGNGEFAAGGGGSSGGGGKFRPGTDIVKPTFTNALNSQTVQQIVSGTLNPGGSFDDSARFGKNGDTTMYALAKEQGFTALPSVVSQSQLDAHIAGGEMELFRGVVGSKAQGMTGMPGDKYAEQFRTGEYFAGQGGYGNGIYSAYQGSSEYNAMRDASLYASHTGAQGAVLRMSLKADAHTVSYDSVLNMQSKAQSKMITDYQTAQNSGNSIAASNNQALLRLTSDVGRFAMSRGYDAIITDSHTGEVIILNRSAVRVQNTNLTPRV